MDRRPAIHRCIFGRLACLTAPGWWLAAGTLLLAAFLFFARLSDRTIWSEELRWVEIPREMLLSRDFFSPTINGHSYYDKPLGSYWLVLAASVLTGSINETAARIPCAIAGIVGVALLMHIARRFFDGATAAFSGLILATSFSFTFFARNATADMENLVGILAALALLLWNEEKQGGWRVLGAWFIMAATSLTKGLTGFVIPVLVFAAHTAFKDGWQILATEAMRGPLGRRVQSASRRFSWLFNRGSLFAIPMAAVVFLLPFAISGWHEGLSNGLGLVYRENIKRFFQPHNHRGPVYLYGYVIFGLMAPWSLFLPAALLQAHHACRTNSEARRGDRFALAFFWSVFAFFTLAASRRSYYLLPILPAAAILVARLMATPSESICRGAKWLFRLGFAVLGASVVAGAFAFLPVAWRPAGIAASFPSPPALPILAGLWIICMATVLFAIWRFSPSRAALAGGAVAIASLIYLNQFALPETEMLRDGKSFARRVQERLNFDTSSLALFRTRDPVFYLGSPTPIRELEDGESLRHAVEAGQVQWLIVRQEHLKGLPVRGAVIDCERAFAWEAESRRSGKHLLVRLDLR